MGDVIPNIAKGRAVELYLRVKGNDPAASALIVVPVSRGAVSDAQLRDAATLAALLGLGVTERTAGGWTRKTLTDADLSAQSPDNANDRSDIGVPAQTWPAVAAGNNSTDLVVCYDPATGTGTDADLVPLVVLDFPITTDGSDVTWQPNASGIFRAA